ncbi:unnamed protein product [Echinostoma caproni]|uniref:BLUF domain-containing protein n=1 Tax=Echinostoma caproni TaxID=27848 RepID=A0A183A444_9TREM|nr:unnamed protein product [Echinostoma caproni]
MSTFRPLILEGKHRHEEAIILVSHFPPGASENMPHRFEFLREEINDRFVRLLQRNGDVLMISLFAHEHVDTFRVLQNDQGERYAIDGIFILYFTHHST